MGTEENLSKEKKQRRKKKRKREPTEEQHAKSAKSSTESSKTTKRSDEKKSHRKVKKKARKENSDASSGRSEKDSFGQNESEAHGCRQVIRSTNQSTHKPIKQSISFDIIETKIKRGLTERLPFDAKYILAPMVGASELAFRLLCRKYGAQLAYTPMMSSTKFANDLEYRKTEFQTIPEDRPLVCHFSANNPQDFAAAARACRPFCDAVDLNLGCPQRTAYVGHFGSYLLDPKDRKLVLDIVRAGVKAVDIPIFCKIRLLDTLEETIQLCQQLREAGVSLIAIHARYRASFERKGPGARDGPAMLDQVLAIRKSIPEIRIIANGNVVTFQDVQDNLKLTGADGVMSAEGILDNPALFLPGIGPRDRTAKDTVIEIAAPSPLEESSSKNKDAPKKERKLEKKLRQIEKIEAKVRAEGENSIDEDQKEKLNKKKKIEKKLEKLRSSSSSRNGNQVNGVVRAQQTAKASLEELYESSSNALDLASEYLSLVRRYPIKIRTVIFHARRMLKDTVNRYQLMEDLVSSQSMEDVELILSKCRKYDENPQAFIFDRDKAARQKEALERKRREEGKRKAFEARMIRKAKREGRSDLEYYLRIGAQVPTVETIQRLKSLTRDKQLEMWKKDHSQHCMSFHLDDGGCKRDRACAFLHIDAKGTTTFVESEEVAG